MTSSRSARSRYRAELWLDKIRAEIEHQFPTRGRDAPRNTRAVADKRFCERLHRNPAAMTAIAIKPAHFPWFDYSRYSFSLGLKTPAGVYLSGHTASEYDRVAKRVVVRGGMIEQVSR
jgi:hypothetical protein